MSRLLAVACFTLMLPFAAAAQQPVTVQGRILDESTGLGVPSAAVELEGHGDTVTGPDGSFRFDAVRPGGYTLWVVAFGYASGSRSLSIRADVAVSVALEPAPVPIEGVGATFVDLEGRVRDPANDVLLVDAMILTNQGRAVGTDAHGRFELEGVPEGAPLHVTVAAFGYLTLDTLLIPKGDESYLFELEPDPVVQAMIDVQVGRLQERAAPHFGALFRNLNRQDILAYAGSHTVRSMIEFEFWSWRNRIALVVVDGDEWSLTSEPLEELFALLPEELQRIEFRQRRGCFRPVIDVYIYTRDYLRGLVALAEDAELPAVYDESRFATCGVPARPTEGGIFQVTR
jgi:hypothetical protein